MDKASSSLLYAVSMMMPLVGPGDVQWNVCYCWSFNKLLICKMRDDNSRHCYQILTTLLRRVRHDGATCVTLFSWDACWWLLPMIWWDVCLCSAWCSAAALSLPMICWDDCLCSAWCSVAALSLPMIWWDVCLCSAWCSTTALSLCSALPETDLVGTSHLSLWMTSAAKLSATNELSIFIEAEYSHSFSASSICVGCLPEAVTASLLSTLTAALATFTGWREFADDFELISLTWLSAAAARRWSPSSTLYT